VQVEDTEVIEASPDGEELLIRINVTPVVGCDIRKIGDDIAPEEKVLDKGVRLGPSELGLIAAVGLDKIEVVKKPIVGLLSTGDEIVEAGEPFKEGHVWDSNKTTLIALLHQIDVKPIDLGIARDNADALYTRILAAFDLVDFLITTGGVSMGEKDMLKRVLVEDFSATIHFGRVNLKPGKPTVFATCEWKGKRKTIFSLPGNPVSAYVTCILFAIPAIRVMSGERIAQDTADTLAKCHKTVKAKLVVGKPIKLDERPEFVRGIISFNETGAQVELIKGSQRSSRLLSTKDANVLVILPSKSTVNEVHSNQLVDAILL
jgi:gephyrin